MARSIGINRVGFEQASNRRRVNVRPPNTTWDAKLSLPVRERKEATETRGRERTRLISATIWEERSLSMETDKLGKSSVKPMNLTTWEARARLERFSERPSMSNKAMRKSWEVLEAASDWPKPRKSST